MSNPSAEQLWSKILEHFDERLQYGFLEQARAVVSVRLTGHELILVVNSDEALSYFRSEINQQRIIIASRQISALDRVSVEKS